MSSPVACARKPGKLVPDGDVFMSARVCTLVASPITARKGGCFWMGSRSNDVVHHG